MGWGVAMNMDGAEEQSGLCEGEGERVGHFSEGKVKFMVNGWLR